MEIFITFFGVLEADKFNLGTGRGKDESKSSARSSLDFIGEHCEREGIK